MGRGRAGSGLKPLKTVPQRSRPGSPGRLLCVGPRGPGPREGGGTGNRLTAPPSRLISGCFSLFPAKSRDFGKNKLTAPPGRLISGRFSLFPAESRDSGKYKLTGPPSRLISGRFSLFFAESRDFGKNKLTGPSPGFWGARADDADFGGFPTPRRELAGGGWLFLLWQSGTLSQSANSSYGSGLPETERRRMSSRSLRPVAWGAAGLLLAAKQHRLTARSAGSISLAHTASAPATTPRSTTYCHRAGETPITLGVVTHPWSIRIRTARHSN